MKFIMVVFLAIAIMTTARAANVLISSGLTCAQKQTMVDTHNTLRGWLANGTTITTQPKASNMQMLAWDDGLEAIAQAWANKMTLGHNPDNSNPNYPTVGENMAYGTDPKFDVSRAIMLWFDEYKNYTFGPMTDLSIQTCGHYSQVVWAKTMYVGCGTSYYATTSGRNIQLYVCNYGPSGNYVGAKPYYAGSGCNNLCCTNQCSPTNLYGSCTASLNGTSST